MIYILTHTLTNHFIRYTFLVPGWTPFCLQNCLNSSRHRFNKVLETFLRDFGPYWHDNITQLLQICRLLIHDVNLPFHHTPKVLYWIEIWWLWRPFGKVATIMSPSCSRNQSEMIWALWHGALSCWKWSSEDGYTVVIKGWTWSATIFREAVAFKQCSTGTKGPKVCQENIPHTITPPPPAWTIETRQDGSMLSCSLRQILTLTSECCSRNRNSKDQATFFQSSVVQLWWVCANCSLRFLFLADRSSTRCGLLLL